jgi:transcriptional regulator with XRE-family HTH domain
MKLKLRFKEIREKYDYTQRQLAEKLGISKSYYNYFETGERIIPLNRLNEYCNLFHVTFDYVLGFTDKLTKPRKKYELDTQLISKRLKEIRKSKK